MADYIEQTERFTLKKNDRKVDVHVTINRTDNFDYMVDRIRQGYISLPGTPPNLPPQVEVFMDQLMSIKRDIEKRKTPSGEIEVGVWRKMRADHLAHATGYLLIALGASQKRRFRIGRITG
jgi:hypothetical protein